jgi:uroporphyrinogen-III synthase
VTKLCERAAWIENKTVRMVGPAKEVVQAYTADSLRMVGPAEEVVQAYTAASLAPALQPCLPAGRKKVLYRRSRPKKKRYADE